MKCTIMILTAKLPLFPISSAWIGWLFLVAEISPLFFVPDREREREGGIKGLSGGRVQPVQAFLFCSDQIIQGSAKRSADFVKQQPGRARQKS